MFIQGKTIEPFDLGELHIYDYTAGQDTRSSLAVITVPPDARHPVAYSKRSDKYYYVVSGEVQFTLDGDVQRLAPGDFCLVRQGQRFSYENGTSEDAALLLVHTPSFDPDSEVLVAEA